MGSAHKIELRVLRLRMIGMVLIGVTALLYSTNGWAESPTKEEISKLQDGLDLFNHKYSIGTVESKEREEANTKVSKMAPTPCICSGDAIAPYDSYGSSSMRVPVVRCKCGEVICVVNLRGGIFCPKQGLFK